MAAWQLVVLHPWLMVVLQEWQQLAAWQLVVLKAWHKMAAGGPLASGPIHGSWAAWQ